MGHFQVDFTREWEEIEGEEGLSEIVEHELKKRIVISKLERGCESEDEKEEALFWYEIGREKCRKWVKKAAKGRAKKIWESKGGLPNALREPLERDFKNALKKFDPEDTKKFGKKPSDFKRTPDKIFREAYEVGASKYMEDL